MKYTKEFIASTPFLDTYEWRETRMHALVKYGNRCQCCGARPEAGNDVVIHVDHILPRKTHPELATEVDNLQVLCKECNHGKSNWDQTDWRYVKDAQELPEALARQVMKDFIIDSYVDKKSDKNAKLLNINLKIHKTVSNRVRKFRLRNNLTVAVVVMNLLATIPSRSRLLYNRSSSDKLFSLGRKVTTGSILKTIDFLEKQEYLKNYIGKGSPIKKYREMSYIVPTQRFVDDFLTENVLSSLSEIELDWFKNNWLYIEHKSKQEGQ